MKEEKLNNLPIIPRNWFAIFSNIFGILMGSFLVALALNIFYIPSKFVSGGVGGVAVILYYTLGITPSWTIMLLNLPLLIVGFLFLKNPSSLLYTLLAVVSNSFFLALTSNMGNIIFIPDDIIRSIFGGIVVGAGSGLIFRSQGSQGGTDIIGMILREKFNMKIGMFNFSFNLFIMALSGFIFEPYKAMYSILASYFATSIADKILDGLETKKALFIFSEKSRDLVQTISETTGYYAILIPRIELKTEGVNANTPSYQYIIYTVAPASRVIKIKNIINSLDPDAFISVSEVSEAMGQWSPKLAD